MVWERDVGHGRQWLSDGLLHPEFYGMNLHLTKAEEMAEQVELRAEAIADNDVDSDETEDSLTDAT